MKSEKRPYRHLRRIMFENDFAQHDLADELGVSIACISKWLRGRAPFPDKQKWAIMDLFHIPESELHLVFPRNGGV